MNICGDNVNIGSTVIGDGMVVHPKKDKKSAVQKCDILVHASIVFYSILLHILGSRQLESQQVTHGCAYIFGQRSN